ncbi:hypothetical protein VTL71DRAFT_12533 [Oculimacula yallundae]|uniref:Developmental regulatory protein wetA n=1 Tax=Oculimacula yallundae TaxID=86028 RepID=A0ABR4CMS9_9HELO
MSFSAVASYSANKGPDMFVQGYEELSNDFFDQFLTYSPTDEETDDYPLPESTFLRSSESNLGGASLSSTDDENKNLAAHSWQGDSWAMEDSAQALPSASADNFYSKRRAAISDSELLSLEGIHLESPRISLPSSPTQGSVPTLRRRNRIVESLSKTFKKASATLDKSVLRSPIRKAKSNPAIMRTVHHSNSNLDLWGQKLDLEAAKFNFDFEQDDLSQPSVRVPGVLRHTQSLDPQKGEVLNGLSYKYALTQHMPHASICDTPLSTPTLDHCPSRRTSQQLRSDNALFPVTPQTQNSSSSWSQIPGSPNFNTYPNSATYPEIESPLWWNDASTVPMAQPSPNNFQTNPQRSNKSLVSQFQNDLAYNNNNSDVVYNPSNMTNGLGLMIQMPDNSAQQSFVMGAASPMFPPQSYFSSSSHSQPHHNHQQRSNHNRQGSSHHARSRQNPHTQQTSPTRTHHSSSLSSDSETPSPPAGFHVRKRKSKTLRSSKGSSTPRTPTSASVDFVNYTPNDSRKILTGVAPSGSSKTKARREKEALDKRRKLSQAAMRAVRAAGGDVESLVEQGLFV